MAKTKTSKKGKGKVEIVKGNSLLEAVMGNTVETVTEVVEEKEFKGTNYDLTPMVDPLAEEEVVEDFVEPELTALMPMFPVTTKTPKGKKVTEPKAKKEVKQTATPMPIPIFREADRKLTFLIDGKRKTFKGNWVINHNGYLLYSGGKGIKIEGGEIKGLRRFKNASGEWGSFDIAPVYVTYKLEANTVEELWAKAYRISFEDEYLFHGIKSPKLPKTPRMAFSVATLDMLAKSMIKTVSDEEVAEMATVETVEISETTEEIMEDESFA